MLLDQPFDFPASDLLVQSIEKLLTGGGSSKRSPLVKGPAKASAIDVTFGGSIEGNAQAIHQDDDLRGPVGHLFDRRLVWKEVTAVDRIVEVIPLVVPLLTGLIVDAIDTPLGTDAVGTLHWGQAQKIDRNAQFSEFHRRRESGQSATDNQHSIVSHFSSY